MFFFLGISKAELRGNHHVYDFFRRTLSGKSRGIVAFRHPYGGEAQLLTWVISFLLKGIARKDKVKFPLTPHVKFIYGYEVPRWGGFIARWIMPRVGAMPIHHAKVDSVGLIRIQKALEKGPYPLALAPEGQVSYSSETVLRLEEGVMRIGFQTALRLEKAGSDTALEILPLSVHFRYGFWAKYTIYWLLGKAEKASGLKKNRGGKQDLYARLFSVREKLLELNEGQYGITPDPASSFSARVDRVMEAALTRAEDILGIKLGTGELIPRANHVRQICWDAIYLSEKDNPRKKSRAERSLADRRAGEAWYAGRHMELVSFVWYFRGPLPTPETPQHLVVEYIQNLWDFTNRTMGGAYSRRINLHPKTAILYAGKPINLTERLADYHRDRRQAVADAMDSLKKEYLRIIDEVRAEDTARPQ